MKCLLQVKARAQIVRHLMNAANNSGPTPSVLTDGVDVEVTARALGLTEDKVRKLCLEHEQEILHEMRTSAEDIIRELAYADGSLSLGEPEIPDPVREYAIRFRNQCSNSTTSEYDDVADRTLRLANSSET